MFKPCSEGLNIASSTHFRHVQVSKQGLNMPPI